MTDRPEGDKRGERQNDQKTPAVHRLRRMLEFRSIRAKITFCLLAVSVLPIVFLSYIEFRSAKQGIRQEILEHLRGAVSLKRDNIEQWYDERRSQVLLARQEPGFERAAVALFDAPSASHRTHPAYTQVDQHLRLYIGNNGFYDEVFLIDGDGHVVYSTHPEREGTHKDNRPYFQEGRHQLFIQSTYHSISLGRTTSTIALPIRRDGQSAGVLAFRLRLDRLHETMRSYAGLGPEGDMYLVNDYNYFVTNPQGKSGYAMERVNFSEPVRRCLRDRSGADEMVSYHGRPVLASFTYLPAYRLCIIGELTTSAAFQPVSEMKYFITLMTAITLAVVMIIAFFLSASISRPIRALTALTTEAEAGNLDMTIELDTRDELGTLARSFNTMLAHLRQRTEQLARSNTDLEQFAYLVSHDLKEPLRSMVGFGQLLDTRYRDQLDDKARDYLRRILTGGERMRQLIDDLLSFSRVSTEARTLETVDTRLVVQEVLTALDRSIQDHGARVELGDLPVLQGHPTQLFSLFQNLIGNAIKFHGEAPPVIRVNARARDHEWELSVQDNGIGIAPEYAERVFQIFQRLHDRSAYPGTGIGLAVCKRIVERHGGRIWLSSEPGAGTTFHFTIPRTPPA